MSLGDAVSFLKNEIKNEGIVPENGLGTELFEYVSTLTPIVNVDLLTFNRKGQVLLSWRKDKYFKPAWHVPGGCIRFKETISDRVQKTALSELGTKVEFDPEPIKVFELFSDNKESVIEDKNQRGHFISLVIGCKAPNSYVIPDRYLTEGKAGKLQWFDELPVDLVPIQECYRRNWQELKGKVLEDLVNG